MEVVQPLGSWGTRQHQVCREAGGHRHSIYGACRVLFQFLAAGVQGLVWLAFLLLGTAGAQRAPLADVLICWSANQALKGHPPLDFPLLGSCWPLQVGRRRGYSDGSTTFAFGDSAELPCLLGFPALLQGPSLL